MMNSMLTRPLALTVLLVCAIVPPAQAGPPMPWTALDIGTARSLPWSQAPNRWDGRTTFDVANLLSETEALLTPSTPVIVRMETLRRAALYSVADPSVAHRLAAALTKRARAEGDNALASFDAAYFTGTLHAMARVASRLPELGRRAADVAPPADESPLLLARALALRPNDAAMHYGAALLANGAGNSKAFDAHLRIASAGVSMDTLLAMNINNHIH